MAGQVKKMKRNYSTAEKKSYKRGFFAGLFAKKRIKNRNINKISNKEKSSSLLDTIKMYRKRNLGVLYHNGKYYDTNFIDKPHEIKKSFIKELHSEYDFDHKRSDLEVCDSYIRHMRHKYGVFDKDGKFLHMMGEK